MSHITESISELADAQTVAKWTHPKHNVPVELDDYGLLTS